MKTNQNEPISAFTELDEQGRPYQFYKGLTKREHFAGLAMQGLLANFQSHGHFGDDPYYPMVSQIAVECADALIAELNRTQD